ncbi:MAG: hypothetical protein WCE63_23090 [Acidobacteriaceae bacterium]
MKKVACVDRIGVYYNGRSCDARIDRHISCQYVQPIEQDDGRNLPRAHAGFDSSSFARTKDHCRKYKLSGVFVGTSKALAVSESAGGGFPDSVPGLNLAIASANSVQQNGHGIEFIAFVC